MGATAVRPAREARVDDADAEVVLGRGEADPVLERIHRLGGGEILAHQEEPGGARGSQPLQPLVFFGPSHQDDVGHLRTVRRVRYGSVTPQ